MLARSVWLYSEVRVNLHRGHKDIPNFSFTVSLATHRPFPIPIAITGVHCGVCKLLMTQEPKGNAIMSESCGALSCCVAFGFWNPLCECCPRISRVPLNGPKYSQPPKWLVHGDAACWISSFYMEQTTNQESDEAGC